MITKFILHGGFTPGKTGEDNSDFYKEILKDVPHITKILIVPFAKDPERIVVTTNRVMSEFIVNARRVRFDFEIATEGSFLDQVQSADIVYFQGGKTVRLLDVLKKFPDLKEALSGKIIAGESAGANVLTSAFYSPSADSSLEGLGFLSIKLIPHYCEKYAGKLDDLKPELETVLLHEYDYKVYEIDL